MGCNYNLVIINCPCSVFLCICTKKLAIFEWRCYLKHRSVYILPGKKKSLSKHRVSLAGERKSQKKNKPEKRKQGLLLRNWSHTNIDVTAPQVHMLPNCCAACKLVFGKKTIPHYHWSQLTAAPSFLWEATEPLQ